MAFNLLTSNFQANRALNKEFGATNYTTPPTLYLRLFTTLLTSAGVGTELTVSGYAPLAITNNTTTFPVSTNRQIINAIDFETDVITADCVVKAVGFFDASTGGNLIYYANNPSDWNIVNGQAFRIQAGQLIANRTT